MLSDLLATVFLRIHREEWLEEVLGRLLNVYAIPMAPQPIVRMQEAASLWLSIGERLEAIGALAVRRQDWANVRRIALMPTPSANEYHAYLLRHAVVHAGRSGLLEPTDRRGVSLVSLARAVVDRLECARPDMANTDERLLDSVCQFDFLAALAAIADHGAIDTKTFYTSFAYYFTERVEPIVEELVNNRRLRDAIFPSTDADLAKALSSLNSLARSEGFRFSGWEGFSEKISKLIERLGR